MKIAMVGTGYIGLVTGTCFAESGNDVTCVDIDREKIENLKHGMIPIYEPGLTELVKRNIGADRLKFTTDLSMAVQACPIVFVGVGTPQSATGEADLSAVWAVVDVIREAAVEPRLVVVKSTCPVGTNAKVLARLNQGSIQHRCASNPEFLKEGCAVEDFLNPDRVILGVREAATVATLRDLHRPFIRDGRAALVMSPESAEMTKYASNCCLATKISFINEIANLCECLGADIADVRAGMCADGRIGFQFYNPGVGFGGSCFPKDVSAMIALGGEMEVPLHVIQAVQHVNYAQKDVLFDKLASMLDGTLSQKTIAVWGLAFKPRTDDIREAPALVLIDKLLHAGAAVRVYDPEAAANVEAIYGPSLAYCHDGYAAVKGADALAIVTEWQEFQNPDFSQIRTLMRHPVIADGRNLYDPKHLAGLGFTYASIGRQTVGPDLPATTPSVEFATTTVGESAEFG